MGRLLEDEKRKKRNQLILGVMLLAVMVLSVIGYSFQVNDNKNDKNSLEYNGFKFTGQGNLWVTKIGQLDFSFLFSPEEVPSINSDVNLLNSYVGEPLYILSDNYDSKVEILRNMQNIALRIQDACINAENCKNNIPVKTCEDNFIIIQESNETNITQNQSCVYITGKSEDLPKITDEFLFKSMGIK